MIDYLSELRYEEYLALIDEERERVTKLLKNKEINR